MKLVVRFGKYTCHSISVHTRDETGQRNAERLNEKKRFSSTEENRKPHNSVKEIAEMAETSPDYAQSYKKGGYYLNYIQEYFTQMKSGEIVVSKRVFRQYESLVKDMEHHDKYFFDKDKANHPIEFIERFCRHSKGKSAGQPIELELFQKAYISALDRK